MLFPRKFLPVSQESLQKNRKEEKVWNLRILMKTEKQ